VPLAYVELVIDGAETVLTVNLTEYEATLLFVALEAKHWNW